MAQLRTSFMQAYSQTCPFFTCFNSVYTNAGSLFNNDDQEEKKNLKSKEKTAPSKTHHSFTLFRPNSLFLSNEQRLVHSLINLNINNLSQLLDNDSTDFKGHCNFVHVLELEKEEQPLKDLQSIETLQSLHLQNNIVLVNNESENSTRIGSQSVGEDQDYSDVQPFEI